MKYSKIKVIKMYKGGYFMEHQDVILNFDTGRVTHILNDKMGDTFDFPKDKVLNQIRKIGILTWDTDYVNEDSRDGEQWSLKVKFEGDEQLSIIGSNDYPDNFNDLCEIISGAIQRDF